MSYPYFLGSNRWPVVPGIQDPDNERERERDGECPAHRIDRRGWGGSGIGLAA
jgi:hypothetical protein